METEAFIHGGMCVNYSGRCTLSNRMTLRDANRGGCAQSCRWQYHLYEDEKELSENRPLFTMGSKDMMTADQIADLMEAGVSSLKIEGRMKTEYYIASIVSVYRRLIDEICENGGRLSEERMQSYRDEIAKGENRESFPGFYPEVADAKSIIFHENSNRDVSHNFLAKVKDYDPLKGTAHIVTRNPIDVNDEIELLCAGKGSRTFILEWMKNEDGEYMENSRVPMRVLEIPMPYEVKENDILRRAK